tara:strand:+ start:476 stop:616 length:141 start_codon:yes stop_codon:yes gene_type:complete
MSAPQDAVSNDMEKARSTYERFMGSLKIFIPIILLIAFLVVILIAP